MAKYNVKGSLDFDLKGIEADSEEAAFIIASDMAMSGAGDWSYNIEEVEDELE